MIRHNSHHLPQLCKREPRLATEAVPAGLGGAGINPRDSIFRAPGAGFTLIEILIAIFIFAIIIVTIFGSFNFVFGNIDSVEKGMLRYDAAKDCLNRMVQDFQGIYVSQPPAYAPPEGEESADLFRFVAQTDAAGDNLPKRIRFTSTAHVPLGKDRRLGIAEIVYYTEPDRNGTYRLRRSDRIDFSEPLAEDRSGDPILCENLKALTIAFLGDNGELRREWDSDSADVGYATPKAILIRLEIGTPDDFHVFDTTVMVSQYREESEPGRSP